MKVKNVLFYCTSQVNGKKLGFERNRMKRPFKSCGQIKESPRYVRHPGTSNTRKIRCHWTFVEAEVIEEGSLNRSYSNRSMHLLLQLYTKKGKSTGEEIPWSCPTTLPSSPASDSHLLNLTESQRVSKPIDTVHRHQFLGAQRKSEKNEEWVLWGPEETTPLLIAIFPVLVSSFAWCIGS